MGGSTYALWTSSQDLGSGTITAGDLKIDTNGDVSMYDVSADRTDGVVLDKYGLPKGHAIDANWNIVPGDTVALVMPYTITMKGDNLVAELAVDGLGTTTTDGTAFTPGANGMKNVSIEYNVFNGAVALFGTPKAVTGTTSNFVVSYFQAQNQESGQADGSIPMIGSPSTDSSDITVVLYITFDENTDKDIDTNAVLALSKTATMKLTQVRCEIPANISNFTGCPTEG